MGYPADPLNSIYCPSDLLVTFVTLDLFFVVSLNLPLAILYGLTHDDQYYV